MDFELRIFESENGGPWLSRETRFWNEERGEERLAGHLFLSVFTEFGSNVSFCVGEPTEDDGLGVVRLSEDEVMGVSATLFRAGNRHEKGHEEGQRLAALAFARALAARATPPKPKN